MLLKAPASEMLCAQLGVAVSVRIPGSNFLDSLRATEGIAVVPAYKDEAYQCTFKAVLRLSRAEAEAAVAAGGAVAGGAGGGGLGGSAAAPPAAHSGAAAPLPKDPRQRFRTEVLRALLGSPSGQLSCAELTSCIKARIMGAPSFLDSLRSLQGIAVVAEEGGPEGRKSFKAVLQLPREEAAAAAGLPVQSAAASSSSSSSSSMSAGSLAGAAAADGAAAGAAAPAPPAAAAAAAPLDSSPLSLNPEDDDEEY
jgi:hypothetical protein